MKINTFLILICLSAGAQQPSRADNEKVCEILASRVYDHTETNRAWSNYQSIHETYCNAKASSYDKAKSLNFNGSVPIDDILLEFGFGTNESEYTRFREQLCHTKDEMYSQSGWLSQKVTVASNAILTTVQQCLVIQANGFFMNVSGINRGDRRFAWNFVNKIPARAAVQTIKLNIPREITCQDENGKLITQGRAFKVGSEGLTLSCQRNTCGSFQLSVARTTYAVVPSSIEVAAYNPPPGKPKPMVNIANVPAQPMKGPWSFDLTTTNPKVAATDTCNLVSAVGEWLCHAGDNRPHCAHSCDPRAVNGGPNVQVVGAVVHSGPYDIDYRDNTGTCSYTFACTKPIDIPDAPAIPEYCASLPPQPEPTVIRPVRKTLKGQGERAPQAGRGS